MPAKRHSDDSGFGIDDSHSAKKYNWVHIVCIHAFRCKPRSPTNWLHTWIWNKHEYECTNYCYYCYTKPYHHATVSHLCQTQLFGGCIFLRSNFCMLLLFFSLALLRYSVVSHKLCCSQCRCFVFVPLAIV